MWPHLAFPWVWEIQTKVLVLVRVLTHGAVHGAVSQPSSCIFQVLSRAFARRG